MGKNNQAAQDAKVGTLNRYIRKRFGVAYRVNGYIAKYLLACRSNRQLEACLKKLTEEIGVRITLDSRGILQWQPGN